MKSSELIKIVEEMLSSESLKEINYVNFLATEEYFMDKKSADVILDLLKHLSKSKTVMTNNEKFIKKLSQKKILSNIMFIKSLEDFEKLIKNFSDTRFNYRGFYIIVFEHARDQQIHKIFNDLWNLYINNVNLIHQERKSIEVKTFIPFSPTKCNSTDLVKIASYENGKFTKKPLNFFPEKFNNFHNCSLNLVTFATLAPSVLKKDFTNGSYQLYGRDIEVMNMLETELNFHGNLTYLHQYGSWGVLYTNGTTTGAMGRATRRESDMAWGNLNLKHDRSLIMDFSFGYYLDTLIFVIPKGASYAPLAKLIKPFNNFVWIALLLVILLCIIIIVLLSFVPKHIRNFVYGENVRNPFMNILIALYGGSQKTLPNFTFSRYLLMMFLLFCLVLRSLYQGSLFQFLQSNDNKPEVSSIEEMSLNDFKFNIIPSYDDMTKVNSAIMKNRAIIDPSELKEIMDSTLDITYKGSLLVAISEVLYKNKLKALNQEKLYTICKQPFTMIPISIYYPKNSYLRDPIDDKLVWYQCSGLMSFWASKEVDYKYSTSVTEKGPKPMTLEHLAGTFQIWLVSCLLSIFIFVFENVWEWSSRKIMKRKSTY